MEEEARNKRERSSGWLVLASFVTVLVAQGFRIAGVMRDDGLVLIYIAIGLSAVAALLLLIAVLRARRAGDHERH